MNHATIIVSLLAICVGKSLCYPSFVVSSTEPSKEPTPASSENPINAQGPQIYQMDVTTNVSNRFAQTNITSKVKNSATTAKEATFSVVLPDSAYIAGFVMTIDGKSYEAYIKEKEEAKQIYQQAVESGQSAAHVEQSVRDANRFTVSVNIEPESKATFLLTYEELLQRKNSKYEILLNIRPGQIVKDLNVMVNINESRPLKFVNTPSLRSGNEISKNNDNLKPNTDIKIINSTSAIVTFKPDAQEQASFAKELGTEKENGLAGQFVVEYDIERDPKHGEVLIQDGYFVHFFAPSDIKPLPKQVVFVLDLSGSMDGPKLTQLKEAMDSILSELKSADLFNIVGFADDVQVLDPVKNESVRCGLSYESKYGELKNYLKEKNLPGSFAANEDNVKHVKEMVKNMYDGGLTNIIGGLEVGIFLVNKTREANKEYNHQPMIIFLTDGSANVGPSRPEEITKLIETLNQGEAKIPIFSLSFGDGADRDFLQKLSLENLGFSRHIYEAADAHLQLQQFYKEISSPLLHNVKFEYTNNNNIIQKTTKTEFPLYFDGGELVVAGKILETPPENNSNPIPEINPDGFMICTTGWEGPLNLTSFQERPIRGLERHWAYMTIKQKLDQREAAANKTELNKEILDLALKYSFVTPLTSLVVVKPNASDAVDTQDASKVPDYTSHRFPGGSYSGASYSGGFPRLGMAGPPQFALAASYAPPPPVYHQPVAQLYAEELPIRVAAEDGDVDFDSIATNTTHTTLSGLLNALPWMANITTIDGKITINKAGTATTFKLGLNETISTSSSCTVASDSSNATRTCTLLNKCPQIYPLITTPVDLETYYCPLNEFYGICCPNN